MNQFRWILKIVVTGLLGIMTLASGPVWSAKVKSIIPLSEIEIQDLSHMREEEKLARDVYLTMYNRWGTEIFSKIASSEQKHMDTMKKMLDKYGVPDPALTEIGQFTESSGLGELYTQLVAQGLQTLQDGLKVGATIEDHDIFDLDKIIKETNHTDLTNAYTNLREGSYRHLRSYVNALEILDYAYVPQYISEEEFEDIMGLE